MRRNKGGGPETSCWCVCRPLRREGLGAAAEQQHCPFLDLQIAPAEGPDVSERMVIITGPPEAQFKVSAVLGGGGSSPHACARLPGPGVQLLAPHSRSHTAEAADWPPCDPPVLSRSLRLRGGSLGN